MEILKKIFFAFLALILISSCASPEKIVYLRKDEIDQQNFDNNYQLTFKSDDLLQIIVSSDDLMAAQPFNLPVLTNSPSITSANGIRAVRSTRRD
jgi:polysaccharide export outer membrane protein